MGFPQRVQLRRTKGWRLPPDTVAVTRPGKWGNPFRVGKWFRPDHGSKPGHSHYKMAWQEGESFSEGFVKIQDHSMAVEWFARFVSSDREQFRDLRGKNLACWCPLNGPCHANVLLKLAN